MADKLIVMPVRGRGGAPQVLHGLKPGQTAVFNMDEFRISYIRTLACTMGLELNIKFSTRTIRQERKIEVTRIA